MHHVLSGLSAHTLTVFYAFSDGDCRGGQFSEWISLITVNCSWALIQVLELHTVGLMQQLNLMFHLWLSVAKSSAAPGCNHTQQR